MERIPTPVNMRTRVPTTERSLNERADAFELDGNADLQPSDAVVLLQDRGFEFDGDKNLQPVNVANSDTFWETDGNTDWMPQ